MLGIGIGVNRLTGLLDVIPLPNTITITGEPDAGTLTTATAGQTHAELLALIDEGTATTDGPGSVTITATLLGSNSDPVQEGDTITGVDLLYTATEAPSVPRNIVFDPAITVLGGVEEGAYTYRGEAYTYRGSPYTYRAA